MTPNPLSSDGCGAVWVRYGLHGYWRPWFVKTNTVFYVNECFDNESMSVQAAETAHGLAPD